MRDSVAMMASLNGVSVPLWLLCVVMMCTGCAVSAQQGPPPPVLVAAYAAPPVGQVTPVFIEVVAPPSIPAVAHREDIFAVDKKGTRSHALDLEEAGRMAGGAEVLAAALTNDESAVGAIGRSVLSVSGQGFVASADIASRMSDPQASTDVLMLGTAAGLTVGIARGAFLAASPEARHLDEVAAYSLGSRVNANWYPNHTKGFVYFPTGDYTEILATVEIPKSKIPFWLEWPHGSEKTFDVRPTKPYPQAKEPPPASQPGT